jgi:DNA-binding NarL/FixJ family response regulator
MAEPIRLVIVDDHPLFREGVALTLSRDSNLEIVGQGGTGEEACRLVSELLPDVLLLDVTMPGMGGIAAAQRITATWPVVRIIMLTVSEDQDDLMAALRAGARGYVLKGVSAHALSEAVRRVAGGDVYITPTLAGSILFEMTYDEPADPFGTLTNREQEILSLVAQGKTNREIGEHLHLAEKTIKHYMTNVLQKLQVRTRVEAALLAQKRSLEQ